MNTGTPTILGFVKLSESWKVNQSIFKPTISKPDKMRTATSPVIGGCAGLLKPPNQAMAVGRYNLTLK